MRRSGRSWTGPSPRERVAAFAPELRRIAESLVGDLAFARGPVEVMAAFGEPYAALAQCAYLGWPPADAGVLERKPHSTGPWNAAGP